MHENREISCASCPLQQDRSVQAINQNADVNVQEKSDCAVVPMNRPNKEGQPSAEAGEGRVQTEENIVRSHMSPTQSGNGMSLGLDGVRQAASVRKQERFTALLHHVTLNLLRDSFYALKRQAAPGVDGVTWQEYEADALGFAVIAHDRPPFLCPTDGTSCAVITRVDARSPGGTNRIDSHSLGMGIRERQPLAEAIYASRWRGTDDVGDS